MTAQLINNRGNHLATRVQSAGRTGVSSSRAALDRSSSREPDMPEPNLIAFVDDDNPLAQNAHGRLEPARIADVMRLAANQAAGFAWKAVVRAHAGLLRDQHDLLVRLCDVLKSPIEKYMLVGMYEAAHAGGFRIHLGGYILTDGPHGVTVLPQHPIGPYFADFALVSNHSVVVECDGAEFHQNKAKDDARAAEILARGWRIIRFTGSRLFKEPAACAKEALEAAIG